MNKGFDYFNSKDCNAFFRQYLITFLLFYIIAVASSILVGNIYMYVLIAIIPYLVIKRYESAHKPLLDIEQGIQKTDSEYHSILLKKLSERIGNHKIKNEQQRNNILWTTLVQDNKDNVDERIITYKQNVKKLYSTVNSTLFILFITFFVLLFAYASMK